MMTTRGELRRLALALTGAGAAMIAFGLAAVSWPWPLLALARLGVGMTAMLLGILETASTSRRRWPTAGRHLLFAQGGIAFSFGLLTLALPGLGTTVALVATIAWLAASAAVALRGAGLAWPEPTVARPLLGWGLVQGGLLLVALRHPGATVLTLVLAGAAYAIAFGAWLVLQGLLLHRRLRRPERASPGAVLPAT